MMVDTNSLLVLLSISAIVGFLLETKLRDVIRPLALLLSIPMIIWILAMASEGSKIDNFTNLNLWITAFANSLPTMIFSYIGGGIGTALAKGLFNRR